MKNNVTTKINKTVIKSGEDTTQSFPDHKFLGTFTLTITANATKYEHFLKKKMCHHSLLNFDKVDVCKR